MGDYVCNECGENTRGSSVHECPGSDRERIETLEADVVRLETEIGHLRLARASLFRTLTAYAKTRSITQLEAMLGELAPPGEGETP